MFTPLHFSFQVLCEVQRTLKIHFTVLPPAACWNPAELFGLRQVIQWLIDFIKHFLFNQLVNQPAWWRKNLLTVHILLNHHLTNETLQTAECVTERVMFGDETVLSVKTEWWSRSVWSSEKHEGLNKTNRFYWWVRETMFRGYSRQRRRRRRRRGGLWVITDLLTSACRHTHTHTTTSCLHRK